LAFLRFSRDKRGVENFYLVQPTTNRRGKVRPRVLYWFRSPPDVKVGREPFDPDMRRALEAQNPDVIFDWRTIVETPIPSADADKWRERRRTERAAKYLVAEEEAAEAANSAADAIDAEASDALTPVATTVDAPVVSAAPGGAASSAQATPAAGDATRKRRRRRRGGGRDGDAPRPGQAGDQRDAIEPAAPGEPGTKPSGD
jgi:hypothetical protein